MERQAESAKDELATLKKHHELEKHDASVKHEADLGVMDEGYNAFDSDGVLRTHGRGIRGAKESVRSGFEEA